MNENIHTSVVIEVENQTEPENSNCYQVEVENFDKKRDYVLDEVFCGEEVTVYALLEVSEDEIKKSKPPVLKMKHEKANRFHHKSSLKHVTEGSVCTKSNESTFSFLPEETNESENLHCLKHVNGDHEMLTGENPDLKILYNKTSATRQLKSTKSKAISKGVNTDIVQTPKLFQKIQKTLKLNLLNGKDCKEASENECLPPGPFPYNVIETEDGSSFSSVNREDGKKFTKNSLPDLFLVPLLMMDDNMLNKLQVGEKPFVPEKISAQTSTSDVSQMVTLIKNSIEEDEVVSTKLEPENESNECQKKSCKSAIISEIKQLQTRLTSLINTIELDSLNDAKDVADSSSIKMETDFKESSVLSTNTTDEIPVRSDVQVGITSTPAPEDEILKIHKNNKSQDEIQETNLQSVSSNNLPIKSASSTRTLVKPLNEEQKEIHCDDVTESENRKGARQSKSATDTTTDTKLISVNGLRKSLSFDFIDDRLEFCCLKKIKNNFIKFDSNLWIRKKGEGNLNCKIGGEPFTIPKHSNFKIFTHQLENMKFDSTDLKSSITLQEQKGDAKLVFSKQALLSQMLAKIPDVEVHFCDAQFPENNVENEKSAMHLPLKSKPTYDAVNEIPKNKEDSEKPTVVNRSTRKATPPLKKDVKPIKKPINLPNKPKTKFEYPQEPIKHKPLAGSRKFTLRGTAESKLHVDKLVNQYMSNNKLNERLGAKNRSQKRESLEAPNDGEAKEKTEKLMKLTSPLELRKKGKSAKLADNAVTPVESSSENFKGRSENTSTEPKVLVELFTKNIGKKDSSFTKLNDNLESIEEDTKLNTVKEETQNVEKIGVKSVWALTKVLLFDDGSKKIEILEASLTPPEHLATKISQNN